MMMIQMIVIKTTILRGNITFFNYYIFFFFCVCSKLWHFNNLFLLSLALIIASKCQNIDLAMLFKPVFSQASCNTSCNWLLLVTIKFISFCSNKGLIECTSGNCEDINNFYCALYRNHIFKNIMFRSSLSCKKWDIFQTWFFGVNRQLNYFTTGHCVHSSYQLFSI